MSETRTADEPARRGRGLSLWIGFLLVIAAGIGLAWAGAGALRPTITPSGLSFRTVKSGTGETLTRSDAALMDYILSSDDGTVIDSSDSHGGPQPFAMDQVFPGFAEAMSKMQDGGEYRFTMPQSLAFGNGSAPPGFPKNSKLNFEVRVRKVVHGGAALLQQQLEQQQAQQMQSQQQQGQLPGSVPGQPTQH